MSISKSRMTGSEEKNSFNDNNETLCHFKGLILQNILVLQLPIIPISNKLVNTLIEKDHLGDGSPEKDCC